MAAIGKRRFKGSCVSVQGCADLIEIRLKTSLMDELGYHKAQFQQRTEQSTATIASGTSAKAVTFTIQVLYRTGSFGGGALPTIGITP